MHCILIGRGYLMWLVVHSVLTKLVRLGNCYSLGRESFWHSLKIIQVFLMMTETVYSEPVVSKLPYDLDLGIWFSINGLQLKHKILNIVKALCLFIDDCCNHYIHFVYSMSIITSQICLSECKTMAWNRGRIWKLLKESIFPRRINLGSVYSFIFYVVI